TLLDQPFQVWSGSPTTLTATDPGGFPSGSDVPIILEDSTGAGVLATGTSAGDTTITLGRLPDPVPPLRPPFAVLTNPLSVTRGKTIANEVLGSGDATIPGQSFQLQQSPVTYLRAGASYQSTIALTVNGQPWTEVANFYDQPAAARVFVTREDAAG